ncbi:MnhB domain-containing protein [Plantactinospora sp. CA-294935]|uniref:MnhB domain-containing protein n=1 Tax=Plantactinospora sp. CA-294935 TaxID=3240012 RepID=UPI003D8EA049
MSAGQPRSRRLLAADRQRPEQRSVLLEVITRMVYPSVLLVAGYLLLVGLHRPGGGFAAGLVAGLGLVLRRLAGGPGEVDAAAPVPAKVLLGAGLLTCAGYGVAGLLLTGELLAGAAWTVTFGPVTHLELTTSLLFEAGIASIVIGLVLDVLRGLGEDDRSRSSEGRSAEEAR